MIGRMRWMIAGLAAFLVGMPLTEKAVASGWDITSGAIDLGLSIASASAGDS